MKRSESQKQTGPEWSGLMDSLVQSLGGGKAFHPYPAWVSCGLLVSEAPELGTSIPTMYTAGGSGFVGSGRGREGARAGEEEGHSSNGDCA